ncbi:hypothetical protein [Pontivivens ytuae]|uniref:Nitrate reductase n=1 Tax=Pontivivens ytuae TaxID=2789856 RepID=A0A7S9LQM4_9RHOB|nr:hypothetical protein [Pontivivens ytuae]QPH53314.1 hypothetical protein I0K15_16205 [Pontivivens ytuae]
MKNLFARRAAPGRAAEVKAWVIQHLALTDDDLVTVAELACHEPGCPPVETVVTVHGSDGSRRTWCVHRALADIDEGDVTTALSGD